MLSVLPEGKTKSDVGGRKALKVLRRDGSVLSWFHTHRTGSLEGMLPTGQFDQQTSQAATTVHHAEEGHVRPL